MRTPNSDSDSRPGRRGRRGGPHGRPSARPHRQRRHRGDVRAAVLLILNEEAAHGYQLIQSIADRSEGAWTPSAGSIYPVLSQLEDEGLIEIERIDGRKTAQLTDAGRAHVEENLEALGDPFAEAARHGGRQRHEVRAAMGDLTLAVRTSVQGATDEQVEKITALLTETRNDIFRILAGDK